MLKRPKHLPNIKIVDEPPVGYITCTQYSHRVGLNKMALNKAVKDGRIDSKYLVLAPVNGRPAVFFDYNKTVNSYLSTVRERYRPTDWTGGNKPYKELTPEEWKVLIHARRPKRPGPKSLEDRVKAGDVSKPPKELFPDDMHASKLVHEHKKIEKLDIELKLASNKLIAMEDVISNMRMLAVEIKQAWESYEIKCAPKLAAESDPKKCKEIMFQARKEVLDKVGKLTEKE